MAGESEWLMATVSPLTDFSPTLSKELSSHLGNVTAERLRTAEAGGLNTDLFVQPRILPRSYPEYMLFLRWSKELAQKQPIGGIVPGGEGERGA